MFADWWKKAERRIQKQHRKGFNSLCILGAWILWKHRNSCVFDGAAPKSAGGSAGLSGGISLLATLGAKRLAASHLEREVV